MENNCFKKPIGIEQKKYAWDLIKDIDIGKRGDGTDGKKENQYTGMIGEVVFADMMGLERPKKAKGFDDGVDFVFHGVSIDVKTMAREFDVKNYYVNNLYASQVDGERYLNDIYLFTSINKKTNTIQFVGWITKGKVKGKAIGINFYKKGEQRTRGNGTTFEVKGDIYEVGKEALSPFISPDVFVMELGRFFKLF